MDGTHSSKHLVLDVLPACAKHGKSKKHEHQFHCNQVASLVALAGPYEKNREVLI